MSLPKWKQIAKKQTAVDQQTQDIHQKFRIDKISKEFGQLSGEELFKPITKRLDEKSSATAEEEEEEQEVPDYTMDKFDEINPFLVMNSDRMHQLQHHHQYHHQYHHHHHHQHHHPHIKNLMIMIYHHHPHH